MSSFISTASVESIIRAVKNNGSDQWFDIGLELGMNQSAMNRVVEGIPQGGKLSALIEHQKVALGSEELKKKLVEVCSTIPNPIIGAVEDELRSKKDEHTVSPQASVPAPVEPTANNSRLDNKVTSKEAVRVAKKISHIWDEVAAILDPDTFSVGTIENIKKQHDNPFTQARVMLDQWLNVLDDEATCRSLIEALVETNFTAQAKDVFGAQAVQSVKN